MPLPTTPLLSTYAIEEAFDSPRCATRVEARMQRGDVTFFSGVIGRSRVRVRPRIRNQTCNRRTTETKQERRETTDRTDLLTSEPECICRTGPRAVRSDCVANQKMKAW